MAVDHPQRDSGSARPNAKLRKMMEQAELAKEREFYRYYQRPKADGGILSRQPSPVRSLAHALPSALPPALGSPQPSEDKALTAFAQLGALRLSTRRCLISFFDRRNCYILAEATKTLSLHADQAEFSQDSLCWGATIFPKEQSICYYTVNLPVKFSGRPLDDFGDVPSLVVNDLSQDDRFKKYPFVIGAPYSRFYAGVPIRSPNGHSIGTFCVLDDKPRNGISTFELDFLKDMAVTVMRHLEMNRATDDYRRGGIMVKSLGSFAEGKSGLEDWWMDPWEAEPPTSAGPTDTMSLQRQRRSSVSFTTSPRISHEPFMIPRKDSIDSSIPSVKSPNPTSPDSGPPGSAVITPASEVTAEQRGTEVATKTASSTKDDQKDRIAPEITAAFSRAANMIVDATEAEGAVFFDAKISTFGGLVDDDFLTEQPPEPDKPCTVLGYAHCKNPQYPSAPSNNEYSLSESVLRHLLRTYSHGQIFNFDDDIASPINSPSGGGELETSDGFPFSASRRSESTKSSDDENLLRSVFPKARSLVLYPLWDPHRDRWFASAIIWSSDPMRVFTSEQELSYLAAFSNSVMAEVARLDTKLADAAKADFISSISHELRSPLHGILGMTDLLKDTSIDVQQTNQVHTIETCGKTLLDTINHVLDFAKINNLTRGTSKRRKKRAQSAKHVISPAQGHMNDIMTLITDVDMAVLTEEALESVFAGYNFQKTAALTYELSPKKHDAPPIAVIVDINKSDNYVFRTQPGAWRRVIMNLFGNALKYTPAGYIKVKLQVMPKINTANDSCEFRITITDSGIGMSEDYVNNRLFHSFAQENPLSQGTGLGLSIVKQIVESLGGDIEVRSEKGRGTKFSVSCPLKESILSPTFYACGPEKEKERELLKVCKRTKGMVVRFVGFDEEEEYFVKSLKNKTATMLTLKALDNLCTEWFGLTRCYSSDTTKSPDLFIATESGARMLRSEHSKHPDTVSKAPVIVLCQGAESAQATTAQSATAITVPGQIFECIAQPIGPHKLAKALSSCLDRQANRLLATTSEVDVALPKVSQLSLKENTPPVTPKVNHPEVCRPHIASAISAPEVRSVHNSPVKQTKSPVRSLNCLAVDDNPINLRLLRTFIEKLGHRHVLATNGLEAFESYKKVTTPLSFSTGNSLAPLMNTGVDPESRIDVILMDINMPEMDGLEATRQIRSHEIALGLSPVTIIALTGLASSEAQQEAHSSGVNLFLIKPVRLADLEVVLKGVVTGQESVSTDKVQPLDATPTPPGDVTPRQDRVNATIPETQETTTVENIIVEEVHEIAPMEVPQKEEMVIEKVQEVILEEITQSQSGGGGTLAEQQSPGIPESLEPKSQQPQHLPREASQLLNHNESHISNQETQQVQQVQQ